MAEALVGLRVAALAVPQPRSHRRRLLPAARLAAFRRDRLSTARAAVAGPPEVDEDDSMSIDNLHRFFDLNVGKWDGSFYVFFALFASSPLIFDTFCSFRIRDWSDCRALCPPCTCVLSFHVAIRRAREGSSGD